MISDTITVNDWRLFCSGSWKCHFGVTCMTSCVTNERGSVVFTRSFPRENTNTDRSKREPTAVWKSALYTLHVDCNTFIWHQTPERLFIDKKGSLIVRQALVNKVHNFNEIMGVGRHCSLLGPGRRIRVYFDWCRVTPGVFWLVSGHSGLFFSTHCTLFPLSFLSSISARVFFFCWVMFWLN